MHIYQEHLCIQVMVADPNLDIMNIFREVDLGGTFLKNLNLSTTRNNKKVKCFGSRCGNSSEASCWNSNNNTTLDRKLTHTHVTHTNHMEPYKSKSIYKQTNKQTNCVFFDKSSTLSYNCTASTIVKVETFAGINFPN